MKALIFVVSLTLISSVAGLSAQKCLPGHKHKENPSAEKARFAACKVYEKRSCCEAPFTEQLANSPVRAIGNFSWTPCGANLSSECEKFMVQIECFYRCSPDVVYWKNPQFPSAIRDLPLCSGFCDRWFNACRSDLTCGTNWLQDFNQTTQPSSCKTGKMCKNMTETYSNATTMCDSLWGRSFLYKNSKEARDCFDLNNPPDGMVVDYYFGDKSTAPPLSGVLALVLAGFISAFLG